MGAFSPMTARIRGSLSRVAISSTDMSSVTWAIHLRPAALFFAIAAISARAAR
ncbi:Uncharacterised protein [Mycobacteroides abscessus subsp. abscessus]|nr:Uncharacterised protein [Mycobacteroides abscessus subsp. abscessus]